MFNSLKKIQITGPDLTVVCWRQTDKSGEHLFFLFLWLFPDITVGIVNYNRSGLNEISNKAENYSVL